MIWFSGGSKMEDTLSLRELFSIWKIPVGCHWSDATIRNLAVECLAQVKANQIWDSLLTQVKSVNGLYSEIIEKYGQYLEGFDYSAWKLPLMEVTKANFRDLQSD